MRRTILNVWQRLKTWRREICVVLWKECFSIVHDKGWSEWREKSMRFCDKNISHCVIKDKIIKETNLFDFVKRTHFSIYDGGWSEWKGFKSAQVLEAQLKEFDSYGNFILETWTQLERFGSLLLEPWKGIEKFKNFESSRSKFKCTSIWLHFRVAV